VVTYTEKERKIPMKYTVTINEKSRSITVTLADGTKGVARCCPSDRFDINTGVELALERAKVASKAKAAPTPTNPSVMELVKALEKALPKGEIVVVGNGDSLTEAQKKWLVALGGGCSCKCHEVDKDTNRKEAYNKGYENGYNNGYRVGYNANLEERPEVDEDEIYTRAYSEGYEDGYADAGEDYDDEGDGNGVALDRIREVLADVGII
jgi:hypothetical protein